MFSRRDLAGEPAAVREAYAPEAVVLDVETDFETLPPAAAEDRGLFVDAVDPATYPEEWLPADAPQLLRRYAGASFTVGLPGDGTVVWTRQTEPPAVLVKARASGTPDAFLAFLLAEAFVQLSQSIPESFLPFFGERYPDLDAVVPLGPEGVFQIAAALYEAWVGLGTREEFADWQDDHPALYDAWLDAGDRLEDRVEGLPGAVARGETEFGDATELACSAVKHAIEPPPPFAALDIAAHRDHGAEYAVRWAEKTFERLAED